MTSEKVREMTDEELVENSPLTPGFRNRCPIEMERRLKEEIKQLNKSIKKFNKTSSKEANSMIRLTKWIMYLTIFIGALALTQILILIFG